MKIKGIVHNAEEGGFWAEVTSIPECHAQGDTWEKNCCRTFMKLLRHACRLILKKYRRTRCWKLLYEEHNENILSNGNPSNQILNEWILG